jgi:dCTP diphosphatase
MDIFKMEARILADHLDVEQIKLLLRDYSAERDWNKFHNPKNLAMSLACESGELLEIFRWLTEEESSQTNMDLGCKEQVAHELADILLNAIRLADLMDINLTDSIKAKFAINEKNYPADLVRGSAKKYDQYRD